MTQFIYYCTIHKSLNLIFICTNTKKHLTNKKMIVPAIRHLQIYAGSHNVSKEEKQITRRNSILEKFDYMQLSSTERCNFQTGEFLEVKGYIILEWLNLFSGGYSRWSYNHIEYTLYRMSYIMLYIFYLSWRLSVIQCLCMFTIICSKMMQQLQYDAK